MVLSRVFRGMQSIISHSCLVKRDHVVADELDNGIRLYLTLVILLDMRLKRQLVMGRLCMEKPTV